MASRLTNSNSLLAADTTYVRFFKGEIAKLPIVGRDHLHDLDPQIQKSAAEIHKMFPLIVKTPTEAQGNLRDYYCEIHQMSAPDWNTSSQIETAAGSWRVVVPVSVAKSIASKKRKAPEEIAPPVKAARRELKREFIGGNTELARYLQEEIEKLPIVKTMEKAKKLRKIQMFGIAHAAVEKCGLKIQPKKIINKIFNFYCKYRSLLAPGLTPKEKSAVLAAIPRYREGSVIHWARLKKDLKLDHVLFDDVRNVLTRSGRERLLSHAKEAPSRVQSSKPRSSTSVATAAACSASLSSSAIVEEHEYLLELRGLLEGGDEEEEATAADETLLELLESSDEEEEGTAHTETVSSDSTLSSSTARERRSSSFPEEPDDTF